MVLTAVGARALASLLEALLRHACRGSDIEPLRKWAGPPRSIAAGRCGAWVAAVGEALADGVGRPCAGAPAQRAGIDRAASFSWSRYAVQLIPIYERLGSVGAR